MKNLSEAAATWKDGELVFGQYCGVSYKGTIQDHDYLSRRTPDGRNFIFMVSLSEPIVVFGEERSQIQIWTNSESNTIFCEGE